MVDWLPPQMDRFRAIEQVFRDTCLSWGYGEIRTPVVESLYLFTSSGTLTPQMLHRLYSFVDWDGWSGERVVLRPESTIPTVRLFLEGLTSREFARLFYVQNVFSFGAERREGWQMGAEFIGGKSPEADGELIFLAWEVLRRLNIEAQLKLSHVGLVKALLKELGGREEDLDKALGGEISAFGPRSREQENALKLLFELKGKGEGFITNISSLLPSSPGIENQVKDFLSLLALLEDIPYTVDMSLGRGFEYYTGVVFHFYHGKERLGGGGRYDDLIMLLGGRKIPASGFALSLDNLIELIPQPQPTQVIGVIAPSFKEALELCSKLHQKGYIASPQPAEGEIRIEKTPQGLRLFANNLVVEAGSLDQLLSKWKELQ